MTDLTARSLAPPPRPQLAAYVPIPTGYVIHPAANLMRMMTPAEFAELRASIRTEGQKEPIRRLSGAAARVLGQEGAVRQAAGHRRVHRGPVPRRHAGQPGGGRPRRYYKLTAAGRRAAHKKAKAVAALFGLAPRRGTR